MLQNKVLLYIIVGIALMHLGFQILGHEEYSSLIRALIVPLLTILYVFNKRIKKSVYLLSFLILYSISELMEFFVEILSHDILYFYGNSFYIMSYVFLTIEILKSMNSESFFKKYSLQIIVLLILDVLCVYYLTDVTGFEFGYELLFEFVYNVVIMFMMSLALLNFFSRMTHKSMYLFLGTFCLVASEMLIVAYYYIDSKVVFSNTFSILFLLGFALIYHQSRLKHQEFKFLDQPVKASN